MALSIMAILVARSVIYHFRAFPSQLLKIGDFTFT